MGKPIQTSPYPIAVQMSLEALYPQVNCSSVTEAIASFPNSQDYFPVRNEELPPEQSHHA
jgi:hypothetical protein